MNLHYTLPEREKALLCREAGIKGAPVYCVPYDLTPDGRFLSDGWVAVYADLIVVLANGEITRRETLSNGCEVICSKQVSGGVLIFKEGGDERLLCRFSMRHLVRQSYVARGATLLCRGDTHTLESRERELHCPQCGRALRGTRACPRCGGGFRTAARFWDLCHSYISSFAAITVFMAIVSAVTVSQQYVQRRFVDNVLIPASGSAWSVTAFFGIMLAFLAISVTASLVSSWWSNSLGTRMSRDLRARVFYRINELSLSFIDSRQAGELINRVVNDSGRIRQFMEEVFSGMFTQAFIMLGAFGTMLFMDWRLALLTLALVPAAALLVRLFRRREMRLWRQQRRLDDRVNTRLLDVLSGIRVVKSFGKEDREAERFLEYTGRLKQIQRRNERFWATLYPFVTFLLLTGSFFVIYFGGRRVLAGTMTPGQLMQYAAYAGMLFGPLGFLSRLPRMLMQLSNALERIYDILEEETELPELPGAVFRELRGEVEFDGVSFGYRSYEPVLEDISFKVRAGEMIGIVGASGAGKSTLINLLMRLYDVDSGRILLDGCDIRYYPRKCLHRQIGVVLQETFLFTGSIADNIRYARPDASRLEVIRAAKMANAHDFIVRFPDGYDTYVGEHGYNLSGGERQRIAIARAILHNPRLLILDEATSSLDTETEYLIQEAMSRLTAGRTTFAIAHRLSTLKNADRIIVLDGHRIAESGSHEQLMLSGGIYKRLVLTQLDLHQLPAEDSPGRHVPAGRHRRQY